MTARCPKCMDVIDLTQQRIGGLVICTNCGSVLRTRLEEVEVVDAPVRSTSDRAAQRVRKPAAHSTPPPVKPALRNGDQHSHERRPDDVPVTSPATDPLSDLRSLHDHNEARLRL